jgi:peptidyl-prolyl cis-trans isomerase SurA
MRCSFQFGLGTLVTLLCVQWTMPMRAQTVAPLVTTPAMQAVPVTPAQVSTQSKAKTDAVPTIVAAPAFPRMPTANGAEFDRVVAIVNSDLVLDSDVEQDLRLDELEPYGEDTAGHKPEQVRDDAIDRLINRDLILQQIKLQPTQEISNAAVTKELDSLKKNIPACKQFQCETKAGWDKYLASNGFNETELHALWLQRMQVLAFIEMRFRQGVKISPEEIQKYYQQTLLPQYAARKAVAPPLASISDRIQEVLLARQVSSLLNDWLQSLRAQGSVVVLHPGEDAP